MSDFNTGAMACQVNWIRHSFAQRAGLSFAELLTAGMAAQASRVLDYLEHDQAYTADVVS